MEFCQFIFNIRDSCCLLVWTLIFTMFLFFFIHFTSLYFIPPENTKMSPIFWCLQGVYKGNNGIKWVNTTIKVITLISLLSFLRKKLWGKILFLKWFDVSILIAPLVVFHSLLLFGVLAVKRKWLIFVYINVLNWLHFPKSCRLCTYFSFLYKRNTLQKQSTELLSKI